MYQFTKYSIQIQIKYLSYIHILLKMQILAVNQLKKPINLLYISEIIIIGTQIIIPY